MQKVTGTGDFVMNNRVIFDYDRSAKILFVEDQWNIASMQDVDAFFAEYAHFIGTIREKFWMVAHIDRLVIHADVAEYYGEVARRATSERLLGLARWGEESAARMTLRTTAMKAKMPLDIYSSREEAVRAIEKMKAERPSTEE
jgi:hypothetical protein